MLQHWKKIGESRTLFSHPRLTVYEDNIELPDGKRDTYLHFGTDQRISSAIIVAIREDGKILLQKELSYPPDDFLWQFPGGALEAHDESIEHGANRELMEEAGYRAKSLVLLGKYYMDVRRSARQQAVFLAQDLEEASLPEDDVEVFESHWFTEREIDDMITRGDIVNITCLAAWSLYKNKK